MSKPAELSPISGGVPVWIEDGCIHMDVRGMEPPGPLVAIIELIERPSTDKPVIVRLHRDPIFLYPELAERGWNWERLPAAGLEVRLRLIKDLKPQQM